MSITIKSVGDICPGDYSILGSGICTQMKKKGVDYVFDNVPSIFRDSDIVIGNLEGLLSSEVKHRSIPHITFCGLPEFATVLRRKGFNVINVANNHIFEHGRDVFNETVDILEKAGLLICGLKGNNGYHCKPVLLNIKGVKIGILSYNWVGIDKFKSTDDFIAQSRDSMVNYTWKRSQSSKAHLTDNPFNYNKNVSNDITKLKKEADHVILLTHWGYEFVHYPPMGVVKEAHAFIEAGADLIIGGHPHVLQGYEQYMGKWIFYSLGNFVFDMRAEESKLTAVLDFELNGNDQDRFKFHFCKINRFFQPYVVQGNTNKDVEKRMKAYSDIFKQHDCSAVLDDDVIYRAYEKEYKKRKFLNIISHFFEIKKNPIVFRTIIKKFMNVFTIILLKIKGNNVRW